jgi:hypothetical protein
MEDDISKNASSAYHTIQLVKEQAANEARLDKRAKEASVKLESLLNEQTLLLREANEHAALAEERANDSEQEARKARRHAIWSNIIAVIALAIAAVQYLTGS